MMIYNNPVDYKILVTLDMFEELTECENIQAIKESTRDVSNVTRLINRFGEILRYINTNLTNNEKLRIPLLAKQFTVIYMLITRVITGFGVTLTVFIRLEES